MSLALNRLQRRRQFLQVAASGRKWVAPGMIVQALSRAHAEKEGGEKEDDQRKNAQREGEAAKARFVGVGFTVSRKVGNAVKRNRVRRRLRAVAEQVIPNHAIEDHDFVIIGRALALSRPFSILVNDLETALKKLKAYR